MKIISNVIFTEEELKSLIEVANFDCVSVPCHLCPFHIDIKKRNCIKLSIRNMLEERGIHGTNN